MPIESKPDPLSESNRTSQGWLAKCGLSIPTLSVRSKHAPEEDPNRLVMSTPKSYDNKRRKIHPENQMANTKPKNPLGLFSSRRGGNDARLDSKDVSNAPPQRVLRSRAQNATAASNQNSAPNYNNPYLEKAQDELKFLHNGLKESGLHQNYAQRRENLLAAEDQRSWDRGAKDDASADEVNADKIIRALREYERTDIFGNNASEAIPGPETLDMGGQFLTNKSRIEKWSKVFHIARMVPKGALLHLHFNAELYPEQLLAQARTMPNLYIRSIRPLETQEDLDLTETVFDVLPVGTDSFSVFNSDYKGTATNHKGPNARTDIWMLWSKFREEFDARKEFKSRYELRKSPLVANGEPSHCAHPGKVELDAAENWLLQKMVLSEDEAYRPNQTVNGVWARFNQATRCFKGLINYKRVYKWYISEMIDRLIEEKVMYAELRPMLMDKAIPDDNGVQKLNHSMQMNLILEEVKKKEKQLEAENRKDDFPFGLKIIYCTPRSIPNKMMVAEMNDCIALKKEFPDLICGFDLVGAEDRPNHIGHYQQELVAFKEACRAEKIDIPFLFHAGETLLDTGGSTEPSNSNLYDAVLLQSKRIGHGYSLLKHPYLIEHFKKSKGKPGICIELCPISNELLHLCRNIKEHPYPELLAAGIPCTVNSDNPSLFSNSMPHEFYQIMVGAPSVSVHSWKQLALWSLEYSCLTDDEKIRGIEIFRKRWASFCASVIDQYGPLFDVSVMRDENGQEVMRGDQPLKNYKLNVEKAKKSYDEMKAIS